MAKEIDVQYKPKIGYNKDYYSDGVFDELKTSVIDDIPDEPVPITGYLSDLRTRLIQKIMRIEAMLDLVPADIADILDMPLKVVMNDLADEKWDIDQKIIQYTPPETPDSLTIKANIVPPAGDTETPDVPPIYPTNEWLKIEDPDRIPFVVGDIKRNLNTVGLIYQEYVDDLYRALSRFVKSSISAAIQAGVSSIKDLQNNFKVGSQQVPDKLKHVADQITVSQIKRKQETLFFTKIYNIDKTVAHLRQSAAASDLKELYFGGKDKDKTYTEGINLDNWKNSKYITTNSSLDAHQNETLAEARNTYEHKYFNATKNFYKYLMSSCSLTDGILTAYVKEAKSKAILKAAGFDIDQWQKDEDALKDKESKSVTDRTEKAIEKTVKQEADRKKQIEESIYKSDEEVEKYFADFSFEGGGSGGGSSSSSGTSDGPGGIPYEGDWDISSSNGKNNGKGGKEYKVENAPSELGQKILGAAKSFHDKFKEKSVYSIKAGYRNGKLYGDCVYLAFEVVRKVIGDDLGRRYTVGQQLNVPGGQRIWLTNPDKLKAGDIVYQKDPKGKSVNVTFDGKSSKGPWYHVYIADGAGGAYEITEQRSTGINGLNHEKDISQKSLSKNIGAVRRY